MMSTYSFRLRFHLDNGTHISSDKKRLDLVDSSSSATLYLTSWQTDTLIKDSSQLVVLGEGFESDVEAKCIAENCKRALLLWAIKQRCGIDLGNGRSQGGATKYGLAYLEKISGYPCRNDVHGIDVYEQTENLKFVSLNAQAAVLKSSAPLVEIFGAEWQSGDRWNEKQMLACEIYSSSWFDVGSRSRFITLVTAIEALIVQEKHVDEVQSFIDNAKAELTALSVEASVKASILGSLERLKSQSIKQAGKQLASRLLPDSEFYGMSSSKYFSECYDKRSQILHNGITSRDEDMLKLATTTEEFVSKLLLASVA